MKRLRYFNYLSISAKIIMSVLATNKIAHFLWAILFVAKTDIIIFAE